MSESGLIRRHIVRARLEPLTLRGAFSQMTVKDYCILDNVFAVLKQTVSKGGVRLHIHPPKSSQINLI